MCPLIKSVLFVSINYTRSLLKEKEKTGSVHEQ